MESACEGSRPELPMSVPNCTANLLWWKKWLILRLLRHVWYQLMLYCNTVPLL